MKHHLAIATIALLFLTATNAHAACSRDDISFYLSKGFTPEQITAICTSAKEAEAPSPAGIPEADAPSPVVTPEAEAPPPVVTPEAEAPSPVVTPEAEAPSPVVTPEAETPSSPVTPEPEADIAVTPPASGNNKDAERFLREAIQGQDIHIDEGFLHYTARICIPYGSFSDKKLTWEQEACELVRHKVNLQGMRAKREWFNPKLFQPRRIYLEGRIEREVVSDLDNLGPISRKQIMQNLETEVRAFVPIKKNILPERLLESLNKLAT